MRTPSGDVEKHVIGGRTFLTVRESTVAQDFHFLGLVSRAGIDRITMGENEQPEDFARRLMELAVRSGAVLELMGCLILPEDHAPKDGEPGEAWTLEMCKETARFLGGLKSEEDKAAIRGLVLSLLISFFESGIVSLWSSKTSSGEAIPGKSGQTDATGRGRSSSTRSPGATTSTQSESANGRCGSPLPPSAV